MLTSFSLTTSPIALLSSVIAIYCNKFLVRIPDLQGYQNLAVLRFGSGCLPFILQFVGNAPCVCSATELLFQGFRVLKDTLELALSVAVSVHKGLNLAARSLLVDASSKQDLLTTHLDSFLPLIIALKVRMLIAALFSVYMAPLQSYLSPTLGFCV